MEFLQTADVGSLLLISIVLVVLCVAGLLIFFGIQIIGTTVVGVIEMVMGVISGGPAVWCGCLVLLAVCGLCAGGALVVATCSSNPSSMNFCLLFSGG
ncbi:MAG: hypothetical protein HXY41_08325 [Chloroflexi bacterium]|nr:hypothetical protein [Chloroflexota bacterium]